MQVVRIEGGHPLQGSITTSGSKNACLPIFAATLLTDEPCIIENVPNLSDVRFMADILKALGAEVEQIDNHSWRIFAKKIIPTAPYDLVRKMRASVCLMGPLVGRLKECIISLPGGCVIGHRPIDLHLKGFTQLGCDIRMEGGYVHIDGHTIRGKSIFLGGRYGSTVTGTANMLMAAVLTPGITHIECAACEPEIIDLCMMLISMGAHIEGVGSPSLVIKGVEKLHGCRYSVIPDRIEAGTFLIAGLLLPGKITVEKVNPTHLYALIDKLEEAGAKFTIDHLNQKITVNNHVSELKPIEAVTLPYPGFPTDLQAQILTLMSFIPGMSLMTERVYPHRFMHVSELQRMGANISLEGATAIVHGKSQLSGAPVMASDLRASASLFLAGLASKGETCIHRIYHLDRGYEKFDEKLRAVGASIYRTEDDQIPLHLTVEAAFN